MADGRRAGPDDARDHLRSSRDRTSESLTYAYTTEAMADDAVSILDDLAIDRVHVYGFSLGGMVAQQIALRHPDAGALARARRDPFRRSPSGVRPSRRCIAFFQRRGDDAVRGGGLGVGPIQLRPAQPRRAGRPHRRGHRAAACRTRSTSARTGRSCSPPRCTTAIGRLERIDAPTLVVHGAARPDHPGRQRAHDRGAACRARKLKILQDAGHLYPTEEPAVDEAIGDVLRRAR